MANGTGDVLRWVRFSATLLQVGHALMLLCRPGHGAVVGGRAAAGSDSTTTGQQLRLPIGCNPPGAHEAILQALQHVVFLVLWV